MQSDYIRETLSEPDVTRTVRISADKTLVRMERGGYTLWRARKQRKEAWLCEEFDSQGNVINTYAIGLDRIQEEIGQYLWEV